MGLFSGWFRKEFYSVMNDDHSHLFTLLNELKHLIDDEMIKASPEIQRNILGGKIKILIDASLIHFKREEALMNACRYPKFAEHKADHAMLLSVVNRYLTDMVQNKKPFTTETLTYLSNWLTHHIKTSDRHLSCFLRSCNEPELDDAVKKPLKRSSFVFTIRNLVMWFMLTMHHDPVKTASLNFTKSSKRLEHMGRKPVPTPKARADVAAKAYYDWFYGNM